MADGWRAAYKLRTGDLVRSKGDSNFLQVVFVDLSEIGNRPPEKQLVGITLRDRSGQMILSASDPLERIELANLLEVLAYHA